MKLLIQGKQMRVTDGLKDYVAERLVAPLKRFYDDEASELRVEFGNNYGPKGGDDKECHLTMRMAGLATIQIEEATPDPYASLDAASERLMRACRRELERVRLARHRPRSAAAPAEEEALGLEPGDYRSIAEAEESGESEEA